MAQQSYAYRPSNPGPFSQNLVESQFTSYAQYQQGQAPPPMPYPGGFTAAAYPEPQRFSPPANGGWQPAPGQYAPPVYSPQAMQHNAAYPPAMQQNVPYPQAMHQGGRYSNQTQTAWQSQPVSAVPQSSAYPQPNVMRQSGDWQAPGNGYNVQTTHYTQTTYPTQSQTIVSAQQTYSTDEYTRRNSQQAQVAQHHPSGSTPSYDFSSEQGFAGSSMTASGVAPRLVHTREGEARLVEVNERESRVVDERVFEGESRVVGERVLKRERRSETREVKRENVGVERIQRNKIVEVIKEKPVPYDVYQDVVYDVHVDVPIQRTIEREVVTETVIERPVEKIMQTDVEQIIEGPVERIVERPVEIRRTVERPYERIVQCPYDVVRENVTYTENVVDVDERDIGRYPGAEVLPTQVNYEQRQRVVDRPVYVDNIIDVVREVRREKIIEVPTERVVERRVTLQIDRPVPVEREVVHEVEVPVENIIYQPVDYLVEVPVYRENIIERDVPVERIVEREVLEPVEHLIEVPVVFENLIEKPVEMLVEVPVPSEQLMEVPVERLRETFVNIERVSGRPVERVVRKSVAVIRQVEVPFEFTVEHTVPCPVEHVIERKINKFVEIQVEKIVERPIEVERIVEKPVYIDRVKEVPVEVIVENIITVERVVEKEVVIDTVVEKEVEVIVERVVEVPVEKIIEVEVLVHVSRPVMSDHNTEEFYNVETDVQEFGESYVQEDVVEVEDEGMAREIETRTAEVQSQQRENGQLRGQYESLQREFEQCRDGGGIIEENENIRLKARLSDLTCTLRSFGEQKDALFRKSVSRCTVTETVLNKDPIVETLRSQLKSLIVENQTLIRNVKDVAQQVTQIVQGNSSLVASTDFGYKNYQPRSSYTAVSDNRTEARPARKSAVVGSGVTQVYPQGQRQSNVAASSHVTQPRQMTSVRR